MRIEFVMVPVPSDRVTEVYSLLASPPRSTPSGDSGDDVAIGFGGTPRFGRWENDLILRAYRESAANMRNVFDYLAERPDQTVYSEELAKALGLTGSQLAGVMGAFGRRKVSRYSQDTWPIHIEWDYQRGLAKYTMPAQVADVITEARAAA